MIGILVIGQSPRPELLREFRRVLPEGIDIVLRGAMDGLTREQIARHAPRSPDDTLFTILPDGTDVTVSHAEVARRARAMLEKMQGEGCQVTVFCCTGEFPEVEDLPVLFPSRVHTHAACAIAKGRRLGVFIPLPQQKEVASQRWLSHGFASVTAIALAPNAEDAAIHSAAAQMAGADPDLVIYDCMGYGHALRACADEIIRKPAILSIALVARLVGELIDARSSP